MGNIRKMLCLLLFFAMLFVYSRNDVVMAASGDVDEQTIQEDSNMENVATTVTNFYFAERKSCLLGEQLQGFQNSLPAIYADEMSHRDFLQEKGIVLTDTSLQIVDIDVRDFGFIVEAVENALYLVNGVTVSGSITHEIHIYGTVESGWIIIGDEYAEDVSGFCSCSYVPDSQVVVEPQAAGDGSRYCIIAVAETQIGEVETGENITKYGAWIGSNGKPWCASFVSWCADQANVATSIIEKTASTVGMRDFFKEKSRYYNSRSQGGTYTPSVGDIFFKVNVDYAWGHVGIVTSVNGDTMWVIDGNCEDAVRYHAESLTDSRLMGFGNPAYGYTAHTGSSWVKDHTYHWQVCVNCNVVVKRLSHVFSNGSCVTCGYIQSTIVE